MYLRRISPVVCLTLATLFGASCSEESVTTEELTVLIKVVSAGEGDGGVESSFGLECPAACDIPVQGTLTKAGGSLTAVPDPGSTFTSWSCVDDDKADNALTGTMPVLDISSFADQEVVSASCTATFGKAPDVVCDLPKRLFDGACVCPPGQVESGDACTASTGDFAAVIGGLTSVDNGCGLTGASIVAPGGSDIELTSGNGTAIFLLVPGQTSRAFNEGATYNNVVYTECTLDLDPAATPKTLALSCTGAATCTQAFTSP